MITFSYPGYNPLVSIDLPSPEKGDNRAGLEEIAIHATEDGHFKTNITTPNIDQFERNLVFTGLCEETKNAFLEFIKDSLGHYIRYKDYNNREWITQIADNRVDVNNTPHGYEVNLNLLVWEL